MAAASLEERVAGLEAEVKRLKQERGLDKSSEPRGWQRIVGVFQDCPEFEEMVRYGQEWRKSEDPEGENEA